MTDLYTLLSAIADDIEHAVSLPTKHSRQVGAPRLVETDANLPLLNIFCNKSTAARLTTDTFTEWQDHVTVGWYTATRSSMDTGIVPDADMQAHMTTAEAIEQRAIGWVPSISGVSFQTDVDFEEVIRGKVRGNVLGTEVKLRVTRWRE